MRPSSNSKPTLRKRNGTWECARWFPVHTQAVFAPFDLGGDPCHWTASTPQAAYTGWLMAKQILGPFPVRHAVTRFRLDWRVPMNAGRPS